MWPSKTVEGVEALAAKGACKGPAGTLSTINQTLTQEWLKHPCWACLMNQADTLLQAWLKTLPTGGVA